LRERETEENKQAREISIDGLVSIQLAHRAPSAALQLQVLLHICSKEYHGHDMTDYQKAMMRIVLNEEGNYSRSGPCFSSYFKLSKCSKTR
jgi:hypothetical protein